MGYLNKLTRNSVRDLNWILALIMISLSFEQTLISDEKWSRFRGPNGSGVSESLDLPLEFGRDRNVLWKTNLPQGHSSPILSENLIFLTAIRDNMLLTICLDRENGKILWERAVPRSREEVIDNRNNPASPSPVVDDEYVYIFFPEYGVLAYDHAGQERWHVPLGPFNNVYGMGASPILVGDTVVLVCDQSTGSYLLALDKKTGSVRWKTERPEAKSGHSTPILYTPPKGETQIIVPGSFLLTSYLASTGEKLWWVRGLSFEVKSVPVMNGDMIFVNGFGMTDNQPGRQISVSPVEEVMKTHDSDNDGQLSPEELPDQRSRSYQRFVDLDQNGFINRTEWDYYRAMSASENGLLAIRAGNGRGDLTETNVEWRYHKAVPQLPSPLIYRNALYMVNDGGIVTSLNPSNGQILNQGRLHGAIDHYYASPVAADGKILMVSETGKVAILKPDGSLKVLKVNDLGENCYSTPAIVDGRIYIRTVNALYAFGQT